ncbi:MAG: AAA family ATPase [Caldilineales bacterium]
MRVVALYSNKGGVGKTAAAVNLAYLAADSGYRTLLCDLDPQSSATFYFRVKPKLKKQARGLTNPGKAIDASIKGTDFDNLDLLPADFSHRNLDLAFSEAKSSKERLRQVLRPLRKDYDLIFLDSPPTINILAENIFRAADLLVVPLIPTTLSVRTYEQLQVFLKEGGYKLRALHSFLSMVDRRKKLHREVEIEIRGRFDNVLSTSIPYLSLVEQMGIKREPVPVYAPRSQAARSYGALWTELRTLLD